MRKESNPKALDRGGRARWKFFIRDQGIDPASGAILMKPVSSHSEESARRMTSRGPDHGPLHLRNFELGIVQIVLEIEGLRAEQNLVHAQVGQLESSVFRKKY